MQAAERRPGRAASPCKDADAGTCSTPPAHESRFAGDFSSIPAIQRQPLSNEPPPKTAESVRSKMQEWLSTHPAGFPLSKAEIETAEKATGTKAPKKAAAVSEPRFVVHDTHADMSMKHFKSLAGTGPKGAGVFAWIPQPERKTKWNPQTKKLETTVTERDPVVGRPEMFEARRPTVTGFEKGEDIIGEKTREAKFHTLWRATAESERALALERVLADTGLPDDQQKELQAATNTFLRDGVTSKVDGVKTTAGWGVAEICRRAGAVGAGTISLPDEKKHAAATKTIENTCGDKAFAAWLASRDRIARGTHVELAQAGGTDKLPNPPYSSGQYENVSKFYLMSALASRRWPTITTHRHEDRDVPGGHGDPRCFDMHKLYGLIATKMSHPAATIYGIVPKYGPPGDRTANITWTKPMCYGDPPGGAQKAETTK